MLYITLGMDYTDEKDRKPHEKENHMDYKPLPVGIDNFEKLIRNGYYYVDKTAFIKDLID